MTLRKIWFPEIYLKKGEIDNASRQEIIKLALVVKFLVLFAIVFPIFWPVNFEAGLISATLMACLYSIFAPKIFDRIVEENAKKN